MTFSGFDENGQNTNTAVEIYTVGSGWSPQYIASWTPPLYPRMTCTAQRQSVLLRRNHRHPHVRSFESVVGHRSLYVLWDYPNLRIIRPASPDSRE